MTPRWTALALLTVTILAACSSPDAPTSAVSPSVLPDEAMLSTNPAGDPDMRVYHVRPTLPATAAPPAQAAASVLMTNHGGVIMKSSTTHMVFWGTSWSNASYVGDKITGLQTFYQGYGNSNYAQTNTEYNDATGAFVGAGSSFAGYVIDASGAPRGAPKTSAVLSEVCKAFSGNIQAGHYYAVYATTKRGRAGYCAWHSAGNCGGTPIEFAWFFDLAGDPGCDPADNTTGHSQALAALANVSGHELSETVTDPQLNAWYDASGAENADKCAWTFGAPSLTFSNGSRWKVQGNWSNAAYNAGTGYANSSGQKGCIGTT